MRALIYAVLALLSILLFQSQAIAQPDLTVTNIGVGTTSLIKGQLLTITLNIKNIGTATASNSSTGIYLSSTPSFANPILISRISLQSLPAGSESGNVEFNYPLPYNVPSGTNYVFINADDLNVVSESNENNSFYANTSLTVYSNEAEQQNLPYPIIFIHGLNSSRKTWDSLIAEMQNYYGWSNGGVLKFCLNEDYNNATSNIITDYQDWTDVNQLNPADFYTVNFDVDFNGNEVDHTAVSSSTYLSNQAAIVKQGRAIKDAIAHVLLITG